jgi:phosphoribosylformimino-5-aminoimidazole carboxamide ribotide isomerase
MARYWADQGARWLHVVDLDGAFQGLPVNRDIIASICQTLTVPVQLGGGIRNIETARGYMEAGLSRLIIGTMALEDKETLAELCQEYPGQIGVSLDAADGALKTRGWVEETGKQVTDVVQDLEQKGVACLVYTDIGRDGMQTGVNIPAVEALLMETWLPVIAAGGVSFLEDIKALAPLAEKGLDGVITGKAIYAGTLNFQEALDWLEHPE